MGIKMIRRTDMQWNHNTIYTNLWHDNSKVKLVDEDKLAIQIRISWDIEFFNGDDIRDLFDISFQLSSRYYDEDENPLYKRSDLNFDLWSEYDFKDYKTRHIKPRENEFNYCFNLTGVEISGNLWNRDIFESLFISISRSKDGVITDIDNIYGKSIQLLILTEQLYVDLGDLDQVLKPLYTEIDAISFLRGPFRSEYSLEVERNELNLEDNWWEILSLPDKRKLNTIKFREKEDSLYDNGVEFFALSIILADKTNQFGRKVLGILEVTGVVGGIFELFDIWVGTLIGFFYSIMFKKELK